MSRRIAILTGGTSSEREIALRSAKNIQAALEGTAIVHQFVFPEERDKFLQARMDIDCVIPVFHGRGGEDGSVQGFLGTLSVPYIFSGVKAHALAINKPTVNAVVSAAGIHVPRHTLLKAGQEAQFSSPVVIKPVDGGSSIGVTVAKNESEFQRGLKNIMATSDELMIEEYVLGHEYSVAVIDEQGQSTSLPVIGIQSTRGYFDFDSKTTAGLATETCPADISDDLAKKLQDAALKVHQVIGARHVSRSDFIVDPDGKIWFLEVNTIPGMSLLLPMTIKASGREFGQVLLGWVEDAMNEAHEH